MNLSEAQRHWECPPELVSASPPRRVTIKDAIKARFLFWTLLLVWAGAAVTVFKVLPWREHQRLLDSEGAATRAVIIRQQVTHDEDSDRFLLTYDYVVRGRPYQFEVNVPATYSRLAVGSTLPMHYAVSHPEISRLDGVVDDGPIVLVILVGLAWVVLVASAFELLRQRKLLVSGRAACGIVTRLESAESSVPTIHGEFLDSARLIEKKIQGSWKSNSLPAPLIGDTVTVLHDPVRPKRNMLYPARWVQIDSSR